MTLKVHRPYVVAESKHGDEKLVWLGLDEADAEKGILANQYLYIAEDKALLIDPGGYFVFQRVYQAVSEFVDPRKVVGIFYSHQDPDVAGSLNLILEFFPRAKVYVSEIWTRFLPHLGVESGVEYEGIPDKGREIIIEGKRLLAIPAHFLHSPGNFNLYIPGLKALFTGDIGAVVFPPGIWYLFVEDFDEHVRYMEWFHKRFMACQRALEAWLSKVKKLDIEVIAPQHGAIFTGENARRFLKWLESLGEVGAELLG